MFILAGAHYSGLRTESVSKKWAPTDLAAASLRNITVTSAHLAKVVAGPVTAKNPSKKEYKDWGLAMKRIHGYYAVVNKTGLFDPAKAPTVAVGRSNGGKTTVVNKTGLFDPAKAPTVAVGRSNGGKTTVVNKTGLFDPAKAPTVAVGRSNGGKTTAKNRRASADPRHCHRVLIVDKQGTVVHFVDFTGVTAYQSKQTAVKQFVKDGTAMKFRQTGLPGRVCWPAYLEPAPVSSELAGAENAGGDKMVAFTRILHRTTDDALSNKLPTFRANPLHPECDGWCEYPVADRPNAVRQFLLAAKADPSLIKAPWLYMIETSAQPPDQPPDQPTSGAPKPASAPSSGGTGGPRLSWAARAAAAGAAGAVPPGHQPRHAVLLPPGAIPRSAPPPQLLQPGSTPATVPRPGVAIFGAAPQRVGAASGGGGSATAGGFTDVGQGTLVERYAGLKIKNPRVAHTQLRGRLTDTAVLKLGQVKQRHRTAGLEGTWSTICVIGEKSKPRETAAGRCYSIWKVTDLDQTCLSLFLFSGAHDDLWKEPEGTIIALFTPKVRAEGDFSLSVESAEQVWVLGQSPEFGYCKATKKNGEPCRMPVNAARCPYCVYHVQSEYNKMKPVGRNEFQTSNLKTAFRPGMQRGLKWTPGQFETQTAKQQRMKSVAAEQLQGLAADARERGSAAGARYLDTVANPAAAAAAEAASHRKLTPAAAIAAAANKGAVAAALAAAPIPLGRSGGSLVLQLPGQPRQQKRRQGAAPTAAAADAKRRRSGGGSGGGGGATGDEEAMIDLEEDEEVGDELASADDARRRAIQLLRAAGGARDPNDSSGQVPAVLQADVRRRQQQQQAAEQEQDAGQRRGSQQQSAAAARSLQQRGSQQQQKARGDAGRAVLAQLPSNCPPPPLPSVVSGGPSGSRPPPPARRPPAPLPGGGSGKLAAARQALSGRPAAAAKQPAAPKSAMEAAFGSVLQEAASSGAAARGTRYKDLVEDEEFEKLDKVMAALEAKDEAAAKMEKITKLTVQAFRCKLCVYTSERRRPECAAHSHAVERVEATKRWWQCESCRHRFATVGLKYPSNRCPKCDRPGCHFQAVSMLRPPKEGDLERQQSGLASRDNIMARGHEQKWCNSW
ncbi:MCM10-like protein [Micractinium conductrix]|uniref:Protein MCM10 homolog n=1 Tax=Micractinium conductrix TaxID=554055 RepID=A0A2P6V391_9CHLO|nr:MCM10-like protein [Micractinium conductrix]|eukprot:PSC68556.1 MCM10-like protein [Micractinium conductrix]